MRQERFRLPSDAGTRQTEALPPLVRFRLSCYLPLIIAVPSVDGACARGYMPLNFFDMIIMVLLVLFLLRGVMNGLLTEFFALLGLLGGMWYASYAHQDVVPYLVDVIRRPDWREFAAYGVVFFTVLLAAGLLARVASKALSPAESSPLDKVLGAVLGLVRGMAVCSVCLVLLRHFVGSDAPFFKDSFITPWLGPLLDFAKLHLPAGLV